MLRLLGKDRTPLGILVNCKDVVIEKDLKTGLRTLSFSYPLTADLANRLEGETYIQTEDYEYVVKEIGKSNNEWFSVNCKPNIETLIGKPHLKFESIEGTAPNCIRLALSSDTGWTVQEVDKIEKKRTIRKETANTYEIIQEVAKVFMIDIEFDTKKKVVKLYERKGEDKGVYFTNQLNLKSLEEQSNTYNFITRLVPIGKDNLRITDINDGKDYIDNFQYSNKVIAQYWVDKRYTKAENLLEDAKAKLDELSKPLRSYSANVYTFGKDMDLGDTITLIDNIKGIKETQRVVKIKEYPLAPEKNVVEIANKSLSFAEQQKQLQDSASTVEDITTDSGALDGNKIENMPEFDYEIPDGSITGDKIHGETITGDKIAGNTITGNNIVGGSITANQLEAGIIKANSILIEEGAIGKLQIGEGQITKVHIEDGTIDNAKIDKLAVGTAQIQDLAVGTAQIADAAITNAKIGKLAVDNANIKDATITNAKIKDLHADKITAGDIDADRIKTNVIEAINGSFGTINSDKITVGNLDADNIITGNIDADRMTTNVIKAINADITSATIKEAKIGNLNADKITAGDISADRMTTNAIKAINATIGSATIDSAKIGNIDAGKITTGTLDAGRIKAGSIDADKISTEAINAIGVKASDVVADKIEAGTIKITDANIVDGSISFGKIDKVEITDANIKEGTILNAYIKDLNAEKITSGTLDASKVSISSTSGNLSLADNTITIKDNQAPQQTRVQVGKDKRGQYGILVMDAKGEPIFDSDKGVLSEKGLNDGVVSADKIRDEAVGPTKLNIDEIFANDAFIGKLQAVEINADKITTGEISNERLNLSGFISFEMLDSSLNPAFTVVDGKTFINGGKIATNSIEAKSINLKSGLTVMNPKQEISFAVREDGNVEVNGLLRSGNFSEDNHTGYKIDTDGVAILNQAKIRGDVILPNAGITNQGTIGESVRFWAGSDYAGRATAPFRVYQNGDVYAKDVNLSGTLDGSLINDNLTIDNSSLVISNKLKTLNDDGTIEVLEPRILEEYVNLNSGQCTLNTDVVFGNNSVRYSKNNNTLNINNTDFKVESPNGSLLINNSGINILGPSGGSHILKGSTDEKVLGTLVLDSEGSQGQRGDFSFTRKNYKEKCKVDIDGELSIHDKITSQVQKIELKSVKNDKYDGWGFYAN